jgi:hypothetical protein
LFQTQIDGLLNAGSATLGVTTCQRLVGTHWRGFNPWIERDFQSAHRSIRHVLVALLTCLIGIAIVASVDGRRRADLLAVILFNTDQTVLFRIVPAEPCGCGPFVGLALRPL